jgi:uncharacterized protein (TIGR00369 family)
MREAAMTGTVLDQIPAPPSSLLLGWRLVDHDVAKGWIRVGFDGKRDFLNPAGFVQGGIQGAMLDDTMGPAVWLKSKGTLYTATIEMSLRFLAPARPGRLFGEATVLQLGTTIAFLEGKLLDADGTLLARASATARLLPAERAVVRRPELCPANDRAVADR